MSPILTRPVREQLEHDRVIRQLLARYKRKHEVVANPGHEHNEAVTVGQLAVYPDLLLFSQTRARKLEATVEVETGESVNQLEALAEWGVFAKVGVPLHLYVPPSSVESARRLCTEQGIPVAEIWTFHVAFDQVRFTMIHRAPEAVAAARPKPAKPAAAQAKRVAKPVAKAKTPAAPKKAVARKATGAKTSPKPAARKTAAPKKAAAKRSSPARKAKARPAKRR